MIDQLVNNLKESKSIDEVSVGNKDSPQNGLIYFQIKTSEKLDNKMKYFQPQNSAVHISDGYIQEFDIRLGSWNPNDRKEEMKQVRRIVKSASRETAVPITRIHSGGSHSFVPHVTLYSGDCHPDAFVEFVENIEKQIDTLQNVPQSNQ